MPVAASAAPPAPWHEQNSRAPLTLKGIEFTDRCHGWAVGESDPAGGKALIVATRNGGRTWSKQNSGVTDTTLNRVDFVDNTHGWAVGEPFETGGDDSAPGPGTILRTTNGGATWTQQTNNVVPPQDATFANDIEGISFVSRQEGWLAVSSYASSNTGAILHTADGGATYTEQTIPDPATGVADVHFVNASSGWAVNDNGDILATTDGGTTWTVQLTGSGPSLEAVAFYNVLRGVAVGDSGTVWVTTDGGTNWNPGVIAAPSGTFDSTTLTDVTFPTSSRVAVSTEEVGDGHSKVLVSTNGGAVLNVQDSRTSATANSVAYPRGRNAGWITGEGGFIRSNDPNAGAGC
ncbi:MAG: hypothetical protein JWQ99_574 [Blastococcus sp.]|jgi:photosystem II stability/assembly factor-like uncharacterized protein|nr:hypothetical protein [Blastococcus sp.]